MAALDAPIWLLAGGQAKGIGFQDLGRTIVNRARGAAFYGRARNELQRAVAAADDSFQATSTERLTDALGWCWSNSAPGDAILLSPACASFDQFADFQDRGRKFVKLVESL